MSQEHDDQDTEVTSNGIHPFRKTYGLRETRARRFEKTVLGKKKRAGVFGARRPPFWAKWGISATPSG